jgi:dihydroorotate dehydrogenase
MLYPLVLRPLLFQLDAERAHDLTLAGLARLAAWPAVVRACEAFCTHDDPVTLLGLVFPNRIGIAAGLDKNGVAVAMWRALGAGFVELGTVTPLPQPGNAGIRMTRRPESRAILNRMGFNNAGAPALAARLAALAPRPAYPIVVSVGKQASTPGDDLGAVAADYAAAAAAVAQRADFISINISSPNTAGLRRLQEPDAVRRIIAEVRTASPGKPLLVKIAPEVDGPTLVPLVDVILSAGAAGLIATNTLEQFDAAGKSLGGLSGAPLHGVAVRRVAAIRRIAPGCVLIGCGGVDSGAAARRLINAGADLVQVYTGLVYEGPGLIGRLARSIQ